MVGSLREIHILVALVNPLEELIKRERIASLLPFISKVLSQLRWQLGSEVMGLTPRQTFGEGL
jgi:hypothetical protein